METDGATLPGFAIAEKSYQIGLASQERMDRVAIKKKAVSNVIKVLTQFGVEPAEVNGFFETIQTAAISEKYKAAKLLLRPNVELSDLIKSVPELSNALSGYDDEILEQASIQVKYDSYIEKEKELVLKMAQLENQLIPDAFDYTKLSALSTEARQKFHKIKPRTLGQASRISGVNPSDVQILMVYMGR